MSRKFLKKYSNFSREILMEFISPENLNDLDRAYNLAKAERALRRLKKELADTNVSAVGKKSRPFFGKIMEGGGKNAEV